jgi:hypothetical protein
MGKAGIQDVPSIQNAGQNLEDLRMMAGLSDADQSLLSKTGLFRATGKVANIAGLATNNVEELGKDIQNAIIKPETAKAMIMKLQSLPGADKFKNALDAMAATSSNSKRAAMTYGLMQNPAFRELFNSQINESDEPKEGDNEAN